MLPNKDKDATDPTALSLPTEVWRNEIGGYLTNKEVGRLSSSCRFFSDTFKENLLHRKMMAPIDRPALFDPKKILDIIAKDPNWLFKKIGYTDRCGVTRKISPYQLMIASYHFILAPLALKTAQDNTSSDKRNALCDLADQQHSEHINTQTPFTNIDKFDEACTGYLKQCALPFDSVALKKLWRKNSDSVAAAQLNLPTGLLVLFITAIDFSNLSGLNKERLPTISLEALSQAAHELRKQVVDGFGTSFGLCKGRHQPEPVDWDIVDGSRWWWPRLMPDPKELGAWTCSRAIRGIAGTRTEAFPLLTGISLDDWVNADSRYIIKTCKVSADWFRNTPPSKCVELSSSQDQPSPPSLPTPSCVLS